MFRKNLVGFLRDRDGAIAAWFALSLFIFIPLMALVIDMSYAMVERNRLQQAANAAALAAVTELADADKNGTPDNDLYVEEAVAYAYKNLSFAGHGSILHPDCGSYDPGTGTVSDASACGDVVAGNWNHATRTFAPSPAGAVLNAVQVSTHRLDSNDNALTTFLAGVAGHGEVNINTQAIAWAAPSAGNNCVLDGISSGGILQVQQDNEFLDGVCLYGRDQIQEGGSNDYDHEDGTAVYLGLDATIEPSDYASKSDYESFEEALQEERVDQTLLVDNIDDVVFEFDQLINNGHFHMSGSPDPDVPDIDGPFPTYANDSRDSLPSSLSSNTIYRIDGDADVKKDHMGGGNPIQNVAFIAEKVTVESDSVLRNVVILADDLPGVDPVVDVGSNVTIDNVLIVSHGTINFGSNGSYGSGDCSTTKVKLLVIAKDKLSMGSDNTISNMIMLGGGDPISLDIQSNNDIFMTQPQGANGAFFPSNDATTTPPTLVRPTIQGLHEVSLQSTNKVTACEPVDNDTNTPTVTAGKVIRLVD